jgi:hypothetical protein
MPHLKSGLADMMPRRLVVAAGFLMACPCASLHAQGTWDAILTIDPYPSPYYSDWDANPNISTLTLINTTASAEQVRIHFNVTDRSNKVVVSGSSEPEPVGAGATVIFDSPYDVAGSTTHDTELEEIAARTGRLPEGDYTACAVAADASGFVLAESCSMFTIVYPDPPLLLGPMDGEVLDQPDPLFLWTPVQVPFDYQLTYVLRVAEVLAGQSAAEALRSNIPHYQSLDGQMPSLRYPIDARPFETGTTYAWTVQALDQNGYSASANDGRSEIWSFRYQDGVATEVTPPEMTVPLTIRNTALDAGGTPSEAEGSGLIDICAKWETADPIGGVVYGLDSKWAWPGLANVEAATLVRDTLPESNGRRVWALYGSNEKHMLMMSGDCGIGNRTTTTRWTGIRTAGDSQELRDWITTDTTEFASRGETDAKLKFGVAIWAEMPDEVGDESLPAIERFLEGHEFEIQPGLNLFGVLDARLLAIWPWFEFFGHDAATAEIELQGFAGMSTTGAVEASVGNEGGMVGAGVTQEFLVLRAALPEREFRSGWIKSIRTGIEVSFGDSMGVAAKSDITGSDSTFKSKPDVSLHPVLKLTVTMVTDRNDTDNIDSEITWEGALEVDVGIDMLDSGKVDTKPTLRLTTDHQFQPWDGIELALGNPEAAVAINDGLRNAIGSVDLKQLDADITLRGSLILHGVDIAKAAITIGRHADDPQKYWQGQVGRSSEDLKRNTDLLSQLSRSEQDAVARGDSVNARAARARSSEIEQIVQQSSKQMRRDSVILAGYDARYAEGNRAPALSPRESGKWYWKASLTLGNMKFYELVDLIRDIGLAITARRED